MEEKLMGLLKDIAIVAIILFLLMVGLGAMGVSAAQLAADWHTFWQGYHPNLPFGL